MLTEILLIIGILLVLVGLYYWFVLEPASEDITVPTKWSFNEYTNTCFIDPSGQFFSMNDCEAASLKPKQSGQGQTCDSTADCIPNFYCSSCSYKCVQKRPVGAACNKDTPCLDIATCVYDGGNMGVCMAKENTGDYCDAINECDSGMRCVNSHCEPIPSVTIQMRISPLSSFVSVNSRPVIENSGSYIYFIGYDTDANMILNDRLREDELTQGYFDSFLTRLKQIALLFIHVYKVKPSSMNPNFLKFLQYLGAGIKVFSFQEVDNTYVFVSRPGKGKPLYERVANTIDYTTTWQVF